MLTFVIYSILPYNKYCILMNLCNSIVFASWVLQYYLNILRVTIHLVYATYKRAGIETRSNLNLREVSVYVYKAL